MYLYWVDSESKLRYAGRYTSMRDLRANALKIFRNYEDSKHEPCVLFVDEDNYTRQIEKDEVIF
jgi:hypothetical protein